MKLLNAYRNVRALYSLAMLVRDPNRLNEVFEMADALATPESMTPVIDRLIEISPAEVARSIEERHRLPRIDLQALRALPEGTLGREFAEHMLRNNLDPSALPDLPSPDRISFFRAHLYETHDIWHVVTGYHTDLVGELALQGFYLAQIPGPLPALLIAVGFLRSALVDFELTSPFMDALVNGYRMGKESKPLFGVHWDEWWTRPIEDVRKDLGITLQATAASTPDKHISREGTALAA
jgi:ubiquinone biosynthesis protein COQ4